MLTLDSMASIHYILKGGLKMASLSIRKFDDKVYKQLRLRAAKHGVSMEEEVRQILYQVVATPEHISDVFQKYFGEKNGINLEIPKHKPHLPMEFNE
jgi:antitoxin FitA